MTDSRHRLELLAPAKNADFGIAAIDHGADAVYIGGPSFGARANAGNSLADIARLADHAHRFNARVLVALNTLLKDEELETARRLAWQCYEAGADALILQDMGLLELELPPIQLHASTQTDIRTPEKARFLQDVGFSQIVLARELSLAQIRDIAAQTTIPLEFFVHGALCVSYSGLCNLSHATTGRSANRGDCSQACRLPYTLSDAQGGVIAENKHLLSLKDNDQSDNLRALIEAVHGPDAGPVPAALERAEIEAEGEAYARHTRARHATIRIEDGYRDGGGGSEDVDYPTRLGQEMRVLLLLRRVDGALRFWAEGMDAGEAAALSEVSASARRLARLELPDQEAPEFAVFRKDWPEWRKAAVTLCVVGEDGAICKGLAYDGEMGLLFTIVPQPAAT